ncbi:NAD(P)-dependent dehydrogenase (short-subunit alcohol dehydrogenase family) [Zavarzinia compransoris]|uniref:Oxidoreductase n=2 Tax=Zavarzinia compransoris TaxID=1264899 RepID=A0A317E3F1_9PROT|nr:oxidoreductase [Zavarzinia compransoris]TDP45592.1 NAD(P)-dependent dehydrogenase (short-subunit alcohol dehydrogenase family) [Zavarzinia compransoris]
MATEPQSPPRPAMPASALITGGTSGIGLEVAALLAASGTGLIILNGRNEARGQAALERLRAIAPGTGFAFVAADASTAGGARTLAERASAILPGPLGLLVNSAGGDFMPKLFHLTGPDEIEGVIRHWLLSVMHVCRAVLPLMGRGSSIVSVASDAAKLATVGEAAIGAALAGVVMFSRTLAMETKRNGIRVNVVTPSLVSGTGTFDRINADPFAAKLFSKATAMAHLGVPTAADVAEAVVFLAGPAASRISGQAISINGGISAA